MKKILPQMGGGGQNFIYESMGSGGVTNMISISFSGIKMLQTPSPIIIFSSFMPHFSPPPPENGNMKRYAYAEMPSVRFFCGSAHRHLIIRKYRHFIRCILFSTSVIRNTIPPPHQKYHCSMSGNRKL